MQNSEQTTTNRHRHHLRRRHLHLGLHPLHHRPPRLRPPHLAHFEVVRLLIR